MFELALFGLVAAPIVAYLLLGARQLRVSITRGLASEDPALRREAIRLPLEVEPLAAIFLPYAHRERDGELLELLSLRVHSGRWGETTSLDRLGLRLWACRYRPGHSVLGSVRPLRATTQVQLAPGEPVGTAPVPEGSHHAVMEPGRS